MPGPGANIVPDHASAAVVIRVVSDLAETRALAMSALDGVEVEVFADTPALRLHAIDGFKTSIVKYTTDIPKLSNWGRALLIGPGSIRHAHTADERIPKREILEAIGIYDRLARSLKGDSGPAPLMARQQRTERRPNRCGTAFEFSTPHAPSWPRPPLGPHRHS